MRRNTSKPLLCPAAEFITTPFPQIHYSCFFTSCLVRVLAELLFPTWAVFSINTCSLRLFPSLLPVATPFHCFLPRHHLCTPRSLSKLRRSHAHFLSSGSLQIVPQPNPTRDFYVKLQIRVTWESRHLVKPSCVQYHHALGHFLFNFACPPCPPLHPRCCIIRPDFVFRIASVSFSCPQFPSVCFIHEFQLSFSGCLSSLCLFLLQCASTPSASQLVLVAPL